MTHKKDDKRSTARRLLTVFLPLVILVLGAAVAAMLIATRPTAGKGRPTERATLVQVQPATVTDKAVSIEIMGSVEPAREITLRARVSGHVQSLDEAFAPGGILRRGQAALVLDDADYRLALRQAQSAVDQAQADLDLEMGQQRVAQAQLEMLAKAAGEALDGDTSLALRKPQLAQARAVLDNAKANLEQAELNLERTKVRAPFNALVTARSVNKGSEVSTSDTLGTLVGTDEYWITAAVPVDRLRWIDLPHGKVQGSPATVTARSQSAPMRGSVLRLAGSLVESSRMAQLLISVPDPLNLKNGGAPLQLDEYVTVRISGKTMQSVVPLPRAALREESQVWIYKDGALDVRPVTVAWREPDTVYVSSGVAPGEQVVTTDIPTPVQGMKLRIKDADSSAASESVHAG
ncbi:efflux RND transporter periplasmic adaptor subunit [Desulfocurvus sp. DL9XJH121]